MWYTYYKKKDTQITILNDDHLILKRMHSVNWSNFCSHFQMFQNIEDHPLQLFKLLVILFCTCEIYCKPRSTLCAPTARSWLSQGHMLSQQLPTLQCLKFTQQTKIYIPRQQNDDILYIYRNRSLIKCT